MNVLWLILKALVNDLLSMSEVISYYLKVANCCGTMVLCYNLIENCIVMDGFRSAKLF